MSESDQQHFLSNDSDRYEVFIHNESIVAVSSLPMALQQYRSALRELSPRERYSSAVKIYDNFTKKWVR